MQHLQAGHLPEAGDLFAQVCERDPRDAEAWSMLGTIHAQQARIAAARDCFAKAVSIRPDVAEYHYNLAKVLHSLNQSDEAVARYRKALELKPGLFQAYNNLGVVLLAQNKPDEAVEAFTNALAIKPDYPEIYNNLGKIAQDRGDAATAEAHYQKALRLKPNYTEAIYNLGLLNQQQGHSESAAENFKQALRLRPTTVEACINLGKALNDVGCFDDAAQAYQQALQLQPANPDAHSNLGSLYVDMGRIDDAIACFRHALMLDPHHLFALTNLVFSMHYVPLPNRQEHFDLHVRLGELIRSSVVKHATHDNTPDPDRHLRIGYVSGDFRTHPVAFFIEALLRDRDATAFEVICYANVSRPDGVTQQLKALADGWRDIRDMTDARVVELIVNDRIDILIDLSGHTTDNRLAVFAARPAPVQMTYLGYPNTTGIRAIDYRITDSVVDPPGDTDGYYTERLVRLTNAFFCYQPPMSAPDVQELPMSRNGYITFGSFNGLMKINNDVIALWSNVLNAIPGARLLLQARAFADPGCRARLLEQFARHGIEGARLEILGPMPLDAHLEMYHRVDVVLDTFPWGGHTTTCHALWMGVPVVAIESDCFVGRMGTTILSRIGLDTLVAKTVEEYGDIARRLAVDPEQTRALRATLRSRVAQSPLCDGPVFCRELESRFRDAWQRWCGQRIERA